MNWRLWAVFVPAEAALCLIPGPAVLLVVSTALRLGWRKGIASNAGILAGNSVYYFLSMTGLGAVFAASYKFFGWIKWLGAAYLVYLGLREIFARHKTLGLANEAAEAGVSKLFRQGLFTQLSNPKAVLFFAAFLPQFLDTNFVLWKQIGILWITGLFVEFVVLAGYGMFAGAAGRLANDARYLSWTNKAAGSLLILAGAGVALLR